MPKPLLAHIRAQDRVCASGLALAFDEHWVSMIETLFQASAGAKAGRAMATASSNEILFTMFILLCVLNDWARAPSGEALETVLLCHSRFAGSALFRRLLPNLAQFGQHKRCQRHLDIPHRDIQKLSLRNQV